MSSSGDQFLYKTIDIASGTGGIIHSTPSNHNPSSTLSPGEQLKMGNEVAVLTASGVGIMGHSIDFHRSYSVVLSPLKPFTEYSVLVQAFNSMGAGPQSDIVSVTTDESVPSQGPMNLSCTPVSAETLTLSWDPPAPTSVNGVLKGYRVIYRPLGGTDRE